MSGLQQIAFGEFMKPKVGKVKNQGKKFFVHNFYSSKGRKSFFGTDKSESTKAALSEARRVRTQLGEHTANQI